MFLAPFGAQASGSQVNTSFSGLTNGTNPPHNALAVGPSTIVTMEGTQILLTDLSGGAPVTQSVYTFWSAFAPAAGLYDQRAIWDGVNQRFVVLMQYGSANNPAVSAIYMAVSKTATPRTLGASDWYFYLLNTEVTVGGQPVATDRPAAAISGGNLIIAAALYYASGPGYAGTGVWVIPTGAGGGQGIYTGAQNNSAPIVSTTEVTPAQQGIYHVVAGANGTAYLAAQWQGSCSGGVCQMVLGLQAFHPLKGFGPFVQLPLNTSAQCCGAYKAQQMGTNLLLDVVDYRVESLAYVGGTMKGVLWGVAEQVPVGASAPVAHWFKADVTNLLASNSASLLGQGDITGAALGTNVAIFNASMAIDAAGDVIVNVTASGPNMYPAAYYTLWTQSQDTSFGPLNLYRASTGFFDSGNNSTIQRWGLYSSTVVDPNKPNSFWLSDEYVDLGWWQTWVAQVGVNSNASIQSLSVTEAGGSGTRIVTSAPGIATGVLAEGVPTSGIFCPLSNCVAPFVNGATVVLTAAPAAGSTFTGWSGGGCSGTGPCTVKMTASTSVHATFADSASNYTLSVSKTGGGSVSSRDGKSDCGSLCSASYSAKAVVTLTATPAAGHAFRGWGGGCAGAGASPTCTLTITGNTGVSAKFKEAPPSVDREPRRPDPGESMRRPAARGVNG